MGIAQRINSLLNYEIKVDLEKDVDRRKAFLIIGFLLLGLIIVGYVVGNNWFWNNNQSYYEYRIDNLKDTLSKQPDDANVRAELAMANYLNGNSSKSIGILKDILVKEPNHELATLHLGLILSEQKNYQESIGFLTNYIKRNQGLEIRLAYLYLGQDYLAIGKNELALKYLKYATVRDPGNPVVLYNLGRAYEKLNDKKNAIISYARALKLSENYVEADVALKNLIKKT